MNSKGNQNIRKPKSQKQGVLRKTTVRSRLAKSMKMANPKLPSAAALVRQKKPASSSSSSSSSSLSSPFPSHPHSRLTKRALLDVNIQSQNRHAWHRPELSSRLGLVPSSSFSSSRTKNTSNKTATQKPNPRPQTQTQKETNKQHHSKFCPEKLLLPFSSTITAQSISTIPRKTRQSSVNRLYGAYLRKKPDLFQTSTQGCDTVLALERKIYNQAKSKNVYSNLCVHALQEIKNLK
jgi:hypothetical protein